MRDALIIFVSLIAAIVIGGSLYLFGGPSFHYGSSKSPSGSAMVKLAEGINALSIDTRVNYRITNQTDLTTLWRMVYGDNGPSVPTIDFNTREVLAVFDGSHSSGGYSIHVRDVSDAGGKRTIYIVRTAPDGGCPTANAITSPFEIVSLSKSDLPLTHVDEMGTSTCNQ
ncbi:MAG: protease complex subunit PrcB family protein [Candidatus Paceibacterota bacterium]